MPEAILTEETVPNPFRLARPKSTNLRCAIVSAVFPPEFTFSGRVSEQIARALVENGHEVTVLAPFPNRPGGVIFPGYKRSLYRTSQGTCEYSLIHCFSFLAPKSRMLSRLIENLSFGVTSTLRLLTIRKPDVIYSNSWPVFASGLLSMVARWRRIPYVITIQDVYPESLASQERTRRSALTFRMMRAVDKWVAKGAAGLIVICQGFRDLYVNDRGIDSSKVHLVYNWGEPVLSRLTPQDFAEYRRKNGIPQDALLCTYGGNIGPASGTKGLVQAFAGLKDVPAYLLIAGAGSELAACRSLVQQLGSDRVKFHTPWKKEETELVLGAADVVLLPTSGQQALVSVPSKLISYMLMGKPVLAQVNSDSETAMMIRKAHAGWILPSDNSGLLAEQIRMLVNSDPQILRTLGENGKRFALQNLCQDSNLPRVLQVLREVALTEL